MHWRRARSKGKGAWAKKFHAPDCDFKFDCLVYIVDTFVKLFEFSFIVLPNHENVICHRRGCFVKFKLLLLSFVFSSLALKRFA